MHHGTRIALYAQPKELPHRSRVLRKIELRPGVGRQVSCGNTPTPRLHAAIVRAHLEAQAEKQERF